MEFKRLTFDQYADKYVDWVERVRLMHHDFSPFEHETIAWTPLTKPLAACRVALVTTAGVHLRSDEPFDQLARAGDPTFREIPDDTPAAALMVSHNHYDHSDADQDINCVFPIDRLHELVAAGRVGAAAPVHFGLMGFNPNPQPVRAGAATVADRLAAAAVDVALFTPG